MPKNNVDPRGLDENGNATANEPVAQQQPAQQQTQPQRPQSLMTKDQNGNEIPFYPAPRAHASESMTFIGARGQQQFRNREDPGIPPASTQEAKDNAKFVPMPAGGLAALADSLFMQDREDVEAMHGHIFDLFLLNNDLIRTDTDHAPGQLVRIPG